MVALAHAENPFPRCAENKLGELLLIADTHVRETIFTNKAGQQFNPYHLTKSLVSHLNEMYPNHCQLLLGDIAMDAFTSPETPHDYDLVNEIFFREKPIRVQVVMGNHDSTQSFGEKILGRNDFRDDKTFFNYRLPWDFHSDWRGVVLHSFLKAGDATGHLNKAQLRFLSREAKQARREKKKLLIAIHHDPTDVGKQGLTEESQKEFMRIANQFPDTIRLVVKGHRHEAGVREVPLKNGTALLVVDVPPAGLKYDSAFENPNRYLGYAMISFSEASVISVEYYSFNDPEQKNGPKTNQKIAFE